MELFGLVLAGGIGSRLWPLSTKAKPKQFVDVLGCGKSLIQLTHSRLSKFIPEQQICYLTNSDYTSQLANQLNISNKALIFEEPCMRNTAPALALASYKLYKQNPDANLLVCPSDQLINKPEVFEKACRTAFDFVENNDALVTFGVQPNHPNTGYGYIQFDEQKSDVKSVKRFTEKPDLETANRFLNSGDYLWNAGIFVWKASYFVSLIRKFMPEMAQIFDDNLEALNTEKETEFLDKYYATFPKISIDFALLEKADSIHVIPVDMDWDDLGSFQSISERAEKTAQDNIVIGKSQVTEIESTNSFVFNETTGDVLLYGVDDIAVLRANGKLVICSKTKLSELKATAQKHKLV
ncbi:MAG: mannose-1-phosphate guanylyltransferase [Flavobacteriales bacterium]